jgi:TolA-binding protein
VIRRALARTAWAAALILAAAPGEGARRAPESATPSLQEVGNAFESSRLLAQADRMAALEQVDQSLAQVLRGGVDADRKDAARFLAGAVAAERRNFAEAAQAYEQAVGDGKSPFADDAGFAAVEAMEAAGHDAEAAREWVRWEKRFPQSPLIPAARLDQAWNAMRRGDATSATRLLGAATMNAPWMEKNPRWILAKATAAYLNGKPGDALALLGVKPSGAAATYLKALALDAQGSRLKAAAAFQEVSERYPDSPLRDHARLGKADAFLAARDYKSAAEEFARVAAKVQNPDVKAEAELRCAGSVFLTGAVDSALGLLRGIAERHSGADVAARAQFLIGEAVMAKGKPAEAIVEFNRVLSNYFQHKVAASAQYRVARALDALGRRADATGSYQAVVAGYPLEPEAPAPA